MAILASSATRTLVVMMWKARQALTCVNRGGAHQRYDPVSKGNGGGKKHMSAIGSLPEMCSDSGVRFRTTLRFRAANGAVVSVAVDLPVAADETGQALEIARDAIAQVAAAQTRVSGSDPQDTIGPDDCGAAYWSWATPEGWRRSGR
jgi:hypothetical protein